MYSNVLYIYLRIKLIKCFADFDTNTFHNVQLRAFMEEIID